MTYLADGLPAPVPARDGLDAAYWAGLAEDKLMLQRCASCECWQWGAEWVCHRCHALELSWQETEPTGVIYSHQRVWHPVHPALREQGAFVIVLVELPHADNVRLVGNLLGDPMQPLEIGAPVQGVFEHHLDNDPAFSLLQWVVT